MAELSNFKRDHIVGAYMAGASVTKTAELFGVARSTISKIMTAFKKEGKTSSLNQNTGGKRKLSERDRRTLTLTFGKEPSNTALKITAELNNHLEKPVFSKTAGRELHKTGFHRRAAIRKPYLDKFV